VSDSVPGSWWVLYARAGDPHSVRAQLAELRAYVEGEAHGRVHIECSDVGHPGVGMEALLGVARAGAADRVLVTNASRLGRQLHVIRELEDTPARLFVLDAIRAEGTAMPVDLEAQIRELFDTVGASPDDLADRAPSWFHDGILMMLRRQMQWAHAELAAAEGEAPPGFGVTPEVVDARLRAARAEELFAARLTQVTRR
jgi:hypothetical protein